MKIRPGRSAALLSDGARIDALGRESDLVAQLGRLTDSLNRIVEETIAPALASIKTQIQTIETLLGTGEDQGRTTSAWPGPSIACESSPPNWSKR